ncbi:hypothetical protein [Stutzerimonas stutzeri]|uniref:Uncharacterized protein n=1 Tax=Stutzerimonas stutzeri TaxID=316 RepID=A0AA40V8F5_STUST|nr:hypothetical protein [Stutzerimonas stutzeri]MBA1305892.1 hypothetical protein [Stutzerimonas stutzeri]
MEWADAKRGGDGTCRKGGKAREKPANALTEYQIDGYERQYHESGEAKAAG